VCDSFKDFEAVASVELRMFGACWVFFEILCSQRDAQVASLALAFHG
jgi:hypothetical protein